MRLLHTSDWHLGKSDGETSLLSDQQYFIDEICEIIKEQRIDAVLIAGDVYDRAIASADAIALYDKAMTDICLGCNIPVLIIAGNHDSAERLAACSKLLSKAGLFVCGELCSDVSPVVFDDAEIFLLPWITEEKVKSVFPEEKERISDLTTAYAVVTDKMRIHFSEGKKHIIVAHAFITNAETSTSDRAAEIGFATQVPSCVFDGFDYIALGHIHGPQKISDSIRYCGTPMPYSFGKEEKQVKGVVILDTESMEQEFVPLKLLHSRTTLEGTLNEIMNPTCDEICEGYVRLRITDSYVGLETLSELKKIYRHPLEVSGKSFERDGSSVTLSIQELERMENDPVEVFRFFCREEMNTDADEHLTELFINAVNKSEEEEAK